MIFGAEESRLRFILYLANRRWSRADWALIAAPRASKLVSRAVWRRECQQSWLTCCLRFGRCWELPQTSNWGSSTSQSPRSRILGTGFAGSPHKREDTQVDRDCSLIELLVGRRFARYRGFGHRGGRPRRRQNCQSTDIGYTCMAPG